MESIRRISFGLILFLTIITPRQARADLFGGDIVVLTKILIQAIQQLEPCQPRYSGHIPSEHYADTVYS